MAVVHDGRALVQMTEELHPDVIVTYMVTYISMPLHNGLDAIWQLMDRHPGTKVVVLAMQQGIAAGLAGASCWRLWLCTESLAG